VKTALQLLIASVALAAPGLAAHAAGAAAAEDPIAVLLREREALSGEHVTTTPEVFSGALKVTVDITGKPRDEALRLVISALSDSGISLYRMQDGASQARRGGANQPNFAPHPADTKVGQLRLSDAPLVLVLNNLLHCAGKTLVISLDLLKGPGINVDAANITQSQEANILRDALHLQAGLLLDERPGGAFQARKDESFVAADRVLGAVYLESVTVGNVLGALNHVTHQSVAVPDGNSALVTVGFSYRSKKEAENLLRTALAAQAGIVLDDRPDGSLSLHQPERNETFAEPAAAPKP
jgi:hypothetical protein